MSQGPSNPTKILDESHIKKCMAKKRSHIFPWPLRGKLAIRSPWHCQPQYFLQNDMP